ncbi:MAG TPA: nitroreductase family protein [Acidimicrobiales bacterium]|nr:nitroreductase family protein [Acidimicrobiales bacterium]
MELSDALRTTGAVREFTAAPVADDVVARVLDTARFAPSGGNRQGWRLVVVKDAATRRRLREIYLADWYRYLAMGAAGLIPWAPLTDREAEERAAAEGPALAALAASGPGGFAEHLDEVPVLLALFADLRRLAAVDRDLDRYSFAGGASIYPFAWSVLLAARDEGLGGVITTMAIRREDEARALFGAPEHLALAAVIALGYPARRPHRLTRAPVAAFATVDRLDGPAFG